MRITIRNVIAAAEDFLGTVALLAIFVVMLASVIFRYALNDSLVWSEEFARYGLVLLTFLGIATGFRRASHVRIDALSDWFLGRTRLVEIGGLVASVVFMGFLVVQALALSRLLGSSRSAAMGMPMSWLYLAVAVALSFGIVRALFAIVEHLRTPQK